MILSIEGSEFKHVFGYLIHASQLSSSSIQIYSSCKSSIFINIDEVFVDHFKYFFVSGGDDIVEEG